MLRSTLIKIFFIALLVRCIYSLAAPEIYSNVDTEGYYGLGMNLFSHPSLQTLITPYRTPVYGVFLNTVLHLAGVGGAAFGSPAFLRGAQFVVAVQMIIGALAFTALCQILAHLLPKRTSMLFAAVLLLDVFVIGWEHTLMTEGLAISVSLYITAVLLQILLAPTRKKFILLWFLFSFGFLLRPSFIVYPIATLSVVAWYFRKHGRIIFLACVTVAAATMVPLAYARINYDTVHYFGVLFESDIVVLGKILEFNIPIESAKNYPYFYSTVTESRTGNTVIPTGFQLLSWYDPNIWGKAYRFVELQAFNQTVIIHNLPLYIGKAIATIPEILLEVCDFTLVPPASTNLFTRIVWMLQQGYGYAQYATLAVPFLWIPMCIFFFVKPTRWHAITALIGTIAMSQIILTALVVYKDAGGQYGRLMSVVRPHLFLFLFLCAVTCIRMYRKHQI
jgi:hypothetical protein